MRNLTSQQVVDILRTPPSLGFFPAGAVSKILQIPGHKVAQYVKLKVFEPTFSSAGSGSSRGFTILDIFRAGIAVELERQLGVSPRNLPSYTSNLDLSSYASNLEFGESSGYVVYVNSTENNPPKASMVSRQELVNFLDERKSSVATVVNLEVLLSTIYNRVKAYTETGK